MSLDHFWFSVSGPVLRQGDLLSQCLIPVFPSLLGPPGGGPAEVELCETDVVVLTQSCDIEQRRARLIAACPIYSLAIFEASNPAFAKKGRWNEVLKGRVEGLHLLASPKDPSNNRDAFVVDFREIYSLPLEYLEVHARELGARWRLQSPFLEHFSQAFARFFMRVGLPSSIPAFP